jgi:hypothetical protein
MTMTEEGHALEAERLAIERRRMVHVIAEHAISAADLVDLVELLGLEEELKAELDELRALRNGSDETAEAAG